MKCVVSNNELENAVTFLQARGDILPGDRPQQGVRFSMSGNFCTSRVSLKFQQHKLSSLCEKDTNTNETHN